MHTDLYNHLASFVSSHKLNLFKKVIEYRTRYITVALEDIYQPHNASAVLRSCDCFGIQDVHIIENQNTYTVNPEVALGASKWLDLNYYSNKNNNTEAAINHLKSQGYRIVATTPHSKQKYLSDFDLHTGKTALLFGTEMRGLSQNAMELADEHLVIPQYGFTESLNISVSAATILHYLTLQLHDSNIKWKLTQKEKHDIIFRWMKRTVKMSEEIINAFNNNSSL